MSKKKTSPTKLNCKQYIECLKKMVTFGDEKK